MFDSTQFLLFVGASLALLLTPGPAVLFVIARSMDHGRWAGVVSSLGLAVGTLAHLFAVVLGLSALLLASATAYSAIKLIGAAYLVYMGLRQLLTRKRRGRSRREPSADGRKLFYEGVVVNVFNPKPALFFLAFLPQFADPARGNLSLQLAVLGSTFILLGFVTDTVYALAAGTAGSWLRKHAAFEEGQRYVTGSVYLGLGLLTAFSGGQRQG